VSFSFAAGGAGATVAFASIGAGGGGVTIAADGPERQEEREESRASR
jgi:hypothetical protein